MLTGPCHIVNTKLEQCQTQLSLIFAMQQYPPVTSKLLWLADVMSGRPHKSKGGLQPGSGNRAGLLLRHKTAKHAHRQTGTDLADELADDTVESAVLPMVRS